MMKFIITILLYTTAIGSYSQPVTEATASKKAVKYLNDGVQRAMANYFDKAIESFTAATVEEPNFVTAWLYLGDTYRNMKNDSMAAESYQKAVDLNPDGDIWVYSKLAEAEGNMGAYEDALDHIEIFLDNPAVKGDPKTKALRMKVNFEFGKEAINNPVDFDPINMGENINSEYPEYFPSLSVDGSTMVMTRRIPDMITVGPGDLRKIDQEDFYISHFENGEWTPAENMGEPINDKLNQGAQSISADGRFLFYTSCDDIENGYGSCDLYYSYKVGDQWTNPENCGNIINTSDWESQPSISADGRYLFFSSARPGSLGSYDLWMATMGEDGYWEEAQNLGPDINTPYSEQCPFIHPDGTTLYFSSEGHPGMGTADLFYSKKDINGNWTAPVNLGYPINTKNREISLSVSANGTTAYFSSDRGKPLGELDIYSFELPPNVQADPVTYVKAIVTDGKTGLPLKANVQLVDIETGEMIATSTSDSKNGEFLIVLPIGKDYSLYVQKDGYLFHSENFSLITALPDKPFT
ncbi:MAG: tetratricopeptide repeat protein, partial [Chitinophagales bacterium]